MINKHDSVNVQGHNLKKVISEKKPGDKLCVDLIGPWNTQEIKA